MGYIKNYDQLATNDNRKIVLQLVESAFSAIQPEEVFKNFSLENQTLKILDKSFEISNFDRVFLLGFGKGSALMCKILEQKLGDLLTEGYVIDVVEQTFTKLEHTLGTHPLPSQPNFDFTEKVINTLGSLTEKDLVLITTCGGGSVLFEKPHTLNLDQMIATNKALLKSGATISEMNAVRKHLSKVKGGGLAKILYPATIINLLFSDVPGNDLSVIASGPLVKDHTTIEDATKIYEKYNLQSSEAFSPSDYVETPKEDMYFEKVHNILLLSNHTALSAMEKKGRELGLSPFVLTDSLQGDARELGKQLIDQTPSGQILLAGGESTIKITGSGKGGRNQALAMCSLPHLTEGTILVSFDSDGWDFYELAGALADTDTLKKIADLGIDVNEYLDNDNSYGFFEKVGDGILTGKLESNVSDLFIVLKQ
jgi:glycerate 2-kinase